MPNNKLHFFLLYFLAQDASDSQNNSYTCRDQYCEAMPTFWYFPDKLNKHNWTELKHTHLFSFSTHSGEKKNGEERVKLI